MSADPNTDAQIISLAGHVGSGKSTVARIISERTGREIFSTGRIFRDMAERRGMTVLELNEYAREHREVDDEVDGHLRAIAEDPRPLVIDSRMAFFFVPESYKVYLVVDALVGAERVYGAGRKDENYASLAKAHSQGTERQRVEAGRYQDLYGVQRDDWHNYDLVVDSTHASAEEVADVVLTTLDEEDGRPRPRCFLSPRRLLPSRSVAGDEEPFEATDFEPIEVVVAGGHIVIVDGHRRAAAALRTGVHLVECSLVAYEAEMPDDTSAIEFAESRASHDRIAEWETHHGFEFESHPPWYAGG